MHDRPFRGSTAIAAGLLTRGTLRGPRFRRLFPDVYVAAHVPVDLALRSVAALVHAGPGAVLAGYSAAEILGASCGAADTSAEVALPHGCARRRAGLVVHRGALARDEVMWIADLPVTTPQRTAYDLARRAPGLVAAVVAVDALARVGEFAPTAVLTWRNRYLGAPGSARIPQVVRLADRDAGSPMETRTRLALVLHGLPAPVAQFEVRTRGHRYVLDLAYPAYRVAVEYDGGAHREPDRARRDLLRQQHLSAVRWTVVRPRARDVLGRPERVAGYVRDALNRAAIERGLPRIDS